MAPPPSPLLHDDRARPLPTALVQQQLQTQPQLRLESQWTVRALRHPLLRLLGCVVHLLATFFLCASSPLTTSLSTSVRVPVYTHWLAVTLARDAAWPRIAFHIALTVALLLALRLVAYRKLVQPTWNWQPDLVVAHRTITHNTYNDIDASRTDTQATDTVCDRTIELHTHASIDAAPPVTVRVPIGHTNATAQGSWTFVVACYPFAWIATVTLLDVTLHGTALQQSLLSVSVSTNSDTIVQMRAQRVLYRALMTLSVLKLLVTADALLQDTHFCRALYRNALVRARRLYVTHVAVRLVSCWFVLALLVVGGVYFDGFGQLQTAWFATPMTHHWVSNEAWTALLGGFVVALDVLWVVQSLTFPGFAMPVGTCIYGLAVDVVTVSGRFIGRHRQPLATLTSTWLGNFVVLALLLPLECVHLAQLVTYTPASYDQVVDTVSHRVRPLALGGRLPADVTAAETALLSHGSMSRYFDWSKWERMPALALVLLAVGLAMWLWRTERFAVRSAQTPRRSTASKPTRQQQLLALRTQTDSTCTVLATLSVVTAVLQVRSIWRSDDDDVSSQSFAPLEAPGEPFGVLILLLTVSLVVQLYTRYRIKLQLMVLRHDLPAVNSSANVSLRTYPRELLVPFVLELLVCAACLPPFVHGQLELQETRYVLPRLRNATASQHVLPVAACPSRLTLTPSNEQSCDLDYTYPLEVLNMVVLARLYWFVRLPRNALAQRVVNTAAQTARVPVESLRWSFRVAFTLAPAHMLSALVLGLVVATAAAVSIFERPFPSQFDTETHSLWLTIVTMSAVGYGDAYPVTALGRVATFGGAVVGGAVVVSLLTSVFLDTVKGSSDELAVLSAMDRMQSQQQLRDASALLIASAWQWHRVDSTSRSLRTVERRFFSAALQFKRLRKQQPRATAESLEAHEVSAVAHWRTHVLRAWLDWMRGESHAGLSELEREVDALEHAMMRALAV